MNKVVIMIGYSAESRESKCKRVFMSLSLGKSDLIRIETKNNVSNETCQGHQFVMPGLSGLQRSFQSIVL